MKELYAIRHAKSSWKDLNLSDDQRPLNNRGKRDAPQMAAIMAEKVPQLDKLVSSHAVRAHTTALAFAAAFKIDAKEIQVVKELYHAYEEDILNTIYSLEEEWSTVCLFGHNPGFTYFANTFEGPSIDNVPTCGIVHLSSTAPTWQEFDVVNTKITSFIYPKMFI